MKPPGAELIASLAAWGLRVWLITGILLRVTRIRDRFDGLAFVFYTTPWPVIAAGLLVLAHHKRRGNTHRVHRYMVLTGGALFTWFATSWYSSPPLQPKPECRVVQWNISRPGRRLDPILHWLRKQDPDIICISEAQPRGNPTLHRWRAVFPNHQQQEGPQDLLLLVRGEVLASEIGLLDAGSFYALYQLRVRGEKITLLQVDINAVPKLSRRKPLERISELAGKYASGKLVVAGDFNTPRESAHLDDLRAHTAHAFEVAGNGLAETWPSFAPALNIDQIWTSPALRTIRCTQGIIPFSDHRPVVADLVFAR